MHSLNEIVGNSEKMKSMYKLAGIMAKSRLMVPAHLLGSTEDCFSVILLAIRLNLDPYNLAQQTYSIKGRLGYQAQLVNALAMNSDSIDGSFKYEYKDWNNGNGWIRCGARLRGEDEITWGEWTDTSTVAVKNSPLWKSNPKQQASYLVVRNFVRMYCPQALMGMYTEDELRTIEPYEQERDVTPIADLLESKKADPIPTGSLVEDSPEEVLIEVCEEAQEFFEEK